jgi:hypothetical protein
MARIFGFGGTRGSHVMEITFLGRSKGGAVTVGLQISYCQMVHGICNG